MIMSPCIIPHATLYPPVLYTILYFALSCLFGCWAGRKTKSHEPITTHENSDQPTHSDRFISDLARNYKTVDEFDLKLKKQGV